MGQTKSRFRQFTDEQWERIEPLLPSNAGRQGHPFRDNRKIVEAIKSVLERTPPELAADLVQTGVTMCGGGSLHRHVRP